MDDRSRMARQVASPKPDPGGGRYLYAVQTDLEDGRIREPAFAATSGATSNTFGTCVDAPSNMHQSKNRGSRMNLFKLLISFWTGKVIEQEAKESKRVVDEARKVVQDVRACLDG